MAISEKAVEIRLETGVVIHLPPERVTDNVEKYDTVMVGYDYINRMYTRGHVVSQI
jgi:hypothetical protein